ncbi:MAG: MFS transporter [Rhodothermales bacterium]|nr:MFS transporter [Rhodothermales bacterium]
MIPQLPSLSEHRSLRLATVTAMYVAQGIQLGLMTVALPAYMAAQGVSPAAVGGFIGAVLLPWTLKLLYAPLMERYSFLPMGRRRPWVLAGTLGGAAGYLGMALVADPLSHLGALTAAAVAGSVFIALMDVSVDALTIDVVPLEEQPQANAFMWGGKVLGAAGTAAGAAWLLGAVGLSATLGVAALGTAAFALVPLLLRERPGERLQPWTAGEASPEARAVQLTGWVEIGRSLRRVLVLPSSLFVALAAFVFGLQYGLFDALGPVLTVQELAWTDAAYSNVAALAGLVAGVLGMAIGGLLVRWLGRIRALQASLLGLVVLGAAMGLAAPHWTVGGVIQGFIVLTYLLRTLAFIALFAACMALCWKPVAAAQFALYMAIGNLGIASGAALLGPLVAVLSYSQVLFVFAFIPVVALAILSRVRLDAHVDCVAAFDVEAATPVGVAVRHEAAR